MKRYQPILGVFILHMTPFPKHLHFLQKFKFIISLLINLFKFIIIKFIITIDSPAFE